MKVSLTFPLAILLFLPAAHLLAAADKIGEAVYIEGDVSVARGGEDLDPSSVAIGMDVDNFDFMKTGDQGTAQVKVTSPRAPGATIVVSPDTQLSFELSKLQNRERSAVNLVTGSLSLKVAKLGPAQDVSVRTESATMAVRGTDFDVTTTVSGDLLVTADTGEVVCTEENGTELASGPGTVVERIEGGGFRTLPVAAADLGSYRSKWGRERLEAARRNAGRLIAMNARRYRQLGRQLDRDYAELLRQRRIIAKWEAEERGGRRGSAAEVAREKRAVAGTIARLRRTQFMMERVYFRLLRLKTFHDQGLGRGTIEGSLTSAQFYDRFQGERKDLERRMAMVRFVTAMYLNRNDDVDPTAPGPAPAAPPGGS